MNYKAKIFLVGCVSVFFSSHLFSQIQACPPNINFATGDLSFWSARTGLVNGPGQNYPAPNNGVSVIPEYTISPAGITVVTSAFTDTYGGFSTIPVINGNSYGYSVQIGSSATSYDLHATGNNPGGLHGQLLI
jgi:hypothetical protein